MKFFVLSILKMPRAAVWKVLSKTEPKHKYLAFFCAALISSEQVMNMQVFIVKLCTDWGVLGRCLPIAVGYNEPGEILLDRILVPLSFWEAKVNINYVRIWTKFGFAWKWQLTFLYLMYPTLNILCNSISRKGKLQYEKILAKKWKRWLGDCKWSRHRGLPFSLPLRAWERLSNGARKHFDCEKMHFGPPS